MKVRSLLVSMLCMLALSVSFASCSDDDDLLDDSGSTVALPQVRAFFLNAGTQGANNANIAFYAPNGGADFIGDIFQKQNKAKLGDLGQTMIEYNECMYVAVYGSNYLVKLNAAGVETELLQSDSLYNICETANNSDANIFVSIHCNAAEAEAANGTETWACAGSYRGSMLASCIQNQIVDALDRKSVV